MENERNSKVQVQLSIHECLPRSRSLPKESRGHTGEMHGSPLGVNHST